MKALFFCFGMFIMTVQAWAQDTDFPCEGAAKQILIFLSGLEGSKHISDVQVISRTEQNGVYLFEVQGLTKDSEIVSLSLSPYLSSISKSECLLLDVKTRPM